MSQAVVYHAPRFAQLRALRQHHPINEWEAQTRAAFGWKKVDAKK